MPPNSSTGRRVFAVFCIFREEPGVTHLLNVHHTEALAEKAVEHCRRMETNVACWWEVLSVHTIEVPGVHHEQKKETSL